MVSKDKAKPAVKSTALVEVPRPRTINPVSRQTLEELVETARSFGILRISETRQKPFGEKVEKKGFLVLITMHDEDGIFLEVKSKYCVPTIQEGLRVCIEQATKAKQMTWEHTK